MTLLATILAESEHLSPIIMPPLVFAAIAFAIFLVLGIVTWSYRDVFHRHSEKFDKGGHDGHGAGH